MILAIKPGDRLRVAVWKSARILPDTPWCAARTINSVPIDTAEAFGTWREAYAWAASNPWREPGPDLPDSPGDRRVRFERGEGPC